jgi:glycosyltransferase involved in cell wall biosynthesis
MTDRLRGLRIAVAYDCLYPYTVGGGERWYRVLSEGFVRAGASVTYLTRRQWDDRPDIPDLEVVEVSGPSELYDDQGTRRLLPTLKYGIGLFRWLVRHRRDFDAVEVASFPFWSVLAVRAALIGTSVDVVVDWHEFWSAQFWRSYAGPIIGRFGYWVQQLCLGVSPAILVSSTVNADRLAQLRPGVRPIVLAGYFPPPKDAPATRSPKVPNGRYVVYAGRHIGDKGVDLIPPTFELVHQQLPDVRMVVAGDGPMRSSVQADVEDRGLGQVVDVVGFVTDEELDELVAGATCVLLPSRREGYGLMVVDAMAAGTPVVTAGFSENLATGHITVENGRVADPPTPERLAEAIVEVVGLGAGIQESTRDWYRQNWADRQIDVSVDQVIEWLESRLR